MIRCIAPRQLRGYRRHFFTLLSRDSTPSAQTYSLSRNLPYHPSLVYNVISDVDSYCKFVPYCVASTVIHRDQKTNQPAKATLRVGWQSFEETFESELTCEEPYSVVAQSYKHSLFKLLYTRWRIIPQADQTLSRVVMDLKFAFANPLYNAVSATFAPTVTKIMIEAFEKRIAEVHKHAQSEEEDD
ncbi:coenzyme Q-binding protein-like protein coq10, mitochondrial [Lipomyces orientalis]|uniref:Coenzyme Q-binding protein-like protein coq10, mitochondrial n=1 Tax=Lipomyces orientalis TaxID=1233043 RepID=A0ACC3TKX7_9ASCO